MKKYILLLTAVFMLQNANSQSITYKIKNVSVDGTPIAFGAPIEFGTNTSVSVLFTVEFTKPANLTIGSIQHVIGTYNSSGTFVPLINPESMTLGVDNTGFTGQWQKTLYASDYSFTTGNYLVSMITQTTGTPPLSWQSNHVPLQRTPAYSLTANASSIACGSTTPVVFSVSSDAPTNLSTYQWSYGSGWTLSGITTGPTITLIPGTTALTPVTVTPTFNGAVQLPKTYTVTRTPISPSGTISGNSTICTQNSYTINGLQAGETVTWNLSNSVAANLSLRSGSPVNVTKTGGGATTLSATVTNACGQSYTVTPKALFAGAPPAFSLVRASNETCDGIKYHYVPFEIPNRTPLVNYTYNIAPIPGVTVAITTSTYNGVVQDVLRFPKTYVGPIDFTVVASNSCGSSSYYAEEEINSCANLGMRPSSPIKKYFTLYPNPANAFINIELLDKDGQSPELSIITADLYDMMGVKKRTSSVRDFSGKMDIGDLPKGLYILKINIDGQVEHHQVILSK